MVIYFYSGVKFKPKTFKSNINRLPKQKLIIEKTKKRINDKKLNRDMIGSSICLKNLALIKSSEAMSSDYIIEQLMENSKELKPYYMKSLSYYRSGNHEVAFKYMTDALDNKNMKNFVSILKKLDIMNAGEMIEQIDTFNSSLISERETFNKKLADRNSLIFTVIVTINIFALLLNFAVVIVFMDAINMLNVIW